MAQASQDPLWGEWVPIDGGWVRRRPRVLGANDQWGKWQLDRNFNQQFRFNPVSNGTHVQTTSEEFQFRWTTRNPSSMTSQDIKAEHNSASQGTNSNSQQEVTDQSSTPSSNSSSSPTKRIALDQEESKNQTADIKATKEPKHNGSDYKEPTVTPSPPPTIQSSVTLDQKVVGQRKGILPSSSISAKSGVASFHTAVGATVVPIAAPVITASSVADNATAAAAWIFGTTMAGLAAVTTQATVKSAEANAETARHSKTSANAAKQSAEAGTRSAQAAEDGVRIIQKQLEAMVQQNKQGPPPPPTCPRSNSPGHGTKFGGVSSQDESPSSKYQEPPSLSRVESPSPDSRLFSTKTNSAKQVVIPVRSPKPAEPAQAAEASGKPVKSTSKVSWPQVPTSNPGEPSASPNQEEHISSARINRTTPSRVSLLRKEKELQNIRRFQNAQKALKRERERRLDLEKALKELRGENN